MLTTSAPRFDWRLCRSPRGFLPASGRFVPTQRTRFRRRLPNRNAIIVAIVSAAAKIDIMPVEICATAGRWTAGPILLFRGGPQVLRGRDVEEIVELRRQGLSIRAISRILGYHRTTISRYLAVPAARPEFKLVLGNAAHIKNVPGRKTDVKDAAWLADLVAHGLVSGSFVPDQTTQEMRDLLRTRKQLVRERTSHTQRIQKTLECANIKLDSVVSNVVGVSGRRMLEALIAGQFDPKELAAMAHGRLQATPAELEAALRGRITAHHRFMLKLHLDQIDSFDEAIMQLSTETSMRGMGYGPPSRRCTWGNDDLRSHRRLGYHPLRPALVARVARRSELHCCPGRCLRSGALKIAVAHLVKSCEACNSKRLRRVESRGKRRTADGKAEARSSRA